jgi:hypothetical protein
MRLPSFVSRIDWAELLRLLVEKWRQAEALRTPSQARRPTKKTRCAGEFKGIWDAAMVALKAAEQVVFVGYRFPPSDSESRSRLGA